MKHTPSEILAKPVEVLRSFWEQKRLLCTNLDKYFLGSIHCVGIFLLLTSASLAQTTIPDPNFAAAIRAACPTCIDANDNLRLAAATLINLNVRKSGIADLTGIDGFTSLQIITCDSNQLTTLPKLPNSLRTLNCYYNQITSLGTLPPSLQNLNCYNNRLTTLPTLPNTIVTLSCWNNQITTLPTLPNSLNNLSCNNNQLTQLPILPSNLRYLNCSTNRLAQLNVLPANLSYLDCGYNELRALPTLVNGLQNLSCRNNLLTALPSLPNGLFTLNCSYNQLTNLPALPSTLKSLDISSNTAVVFPVLPADLEYLYCNGNRLTTLPVLPAKLIGLYCSFNSLTTLPILPNTLKQLHYANNLLTDFPIFPTGLLQLDCGGHKYTKLPDLPQGLTYLGCYANQLTELPKLPNSLQTLNCGTNQLVSLPTLPNTLQYIYAFNNPTTSLPPLPNNLQTLWVYQTQLSCLPALPNSLIDLRIDPTKIQCLPNVPPKMVVRKSNTSNDIVATPPICTSVVPSIDTKTPTICLGASATLTASACRVGTVKWSNNATGTSISVSPTATTTYTAVCSTACGDGNKSNAITVNISGVMPSVPTITANQTALCSGESATLTTSNCNGTIKWSNNATGNSIRVNPSVTTTYTATCQNDCGISENSKAISITPKPIVPKPDITGSKVFCPNSTATLTNNVTGSGYSYQWKKDGQVIATTASISINNEGTYSVVVTNNGCTNKSDDFVIQKSLISSSITGKAFYCFGTSTTLTAVAQNASGVLQYQWKLEGKNTGDGKSTWAASQEGSYAIEITDANGCKATSTALMVTEKGGELIAQITPQGSLSVYAPEKVLLVATLGKEYQYQWKRDNVNIVGANDGAYTAEQSGNYTVVVSRGECSRTSAAVAVKVEIPLSAVQPTHELFQMMPNPTDGWLIVKRNSQNKSTLSLKLLDLQGRVMQVAEWPIHVSEYVLDMRVYPVGMYLLQIEHQDSLQIRRIIKNQ